MSFKTDNLLTNPLMVLREEFDDWGLLFDPDTGDTYGLNPVGVFVWKRLDGHHTLTDITESLAKVCQDMPPNAKEYVNSFVSDLFDKGFVGHEFNET